MARSKGSARARAAARVHHRAARLTPKRLDKVLKAIAEGEAPATAFCGEAVVEYCSWHNLRDGYFGSSPRNVEELASFDPVAIKVDFV